MFTLMRQRLPLKSSKEKQDRLSRYNSQNKVLKANRQAELTREEWQPDALYKSTALIDILTDFSPGFK